MWVLLQCLTGSEPLTKMGEHASSEWVPLQCLTRLPERNHWWEWVIMHPECECLSNVWLDQTRMGEHASREWASLQRLTRSEPLTRMDKHPESECSSVWPDQNHWQEWVTSSEWVPLPCLTGQNHWPEWVNTSPACECLSCFTGSESLTKLGEYISSLWVPFSHWLDQNHWQERVNTHPGCECLSHVWPDQHHWWEWVNLYPGCECLPVFDHCQWQIRTTDENGWIHV